MPVPNNEKHIKGTVFSVFITFLKLGLTSFGGPIAHIGYFRKVLVEDKHWVSESQFSQLLAICQFLPGPASSQLGFVLGLFRAGWLGALSAFVAFTLPSALLLIVFASILPYLSSALFIAAIHGLKLVACAVVADAVWGMYKNLCPDLSRRLIALFALVSLSLFSVVGMQMWVIAGGALLGFIFCSNTTHKSADAINVHYSKKLGFFILSIFFLLLLTLPLFSHYGGLYNLAAAFYQAGALVFGGGHVVLPLLEHSIVDAGLVSHADFLAGYGASQAIPGPMFAFSAYLGSLISLDYSRVFLGFFTFFSLSICILNTNNIRFYPDIE